MTAAEAGPAPATAGAHRLQVVHGRRRPDREAARRAVADLRGVRAAGAQTVTSALHGALREDDRSRQEFFALAVGAR